MPSYQVMTPAPGPPPEHLGVDPEVLGNADRGGRPSHLRLVEGDMYADWEAVYLDNVDRIYRLMFSRVGNRPDAEDLTSEVFRAALGPLRLNSSKGEVRSYLLTTAQTVLASHWRRRFSLEITAIDPDTDIAYVADSAVVSDAPERAATILRALPERYRRVLELRFLEACSIKEVAREMDVSVSNAKVLQYRALRMAAAMAEEAGS